VDLPTYTNIWRIEKRLYKLYDFRLPMPLPVGQIAVFAAIAVPYVVVLTLLGLSFSHTLLWLYVLPPGVLAWLATRPVLESKRLPELIISQVRYLSEPRTWCRMAPLAEKDEIVLTGRVWRRARQEPVTVPEQSAGHVAVPVQSDVPATSREAVPLTTATPVSASRRVAVTARQRVPVAGRHAAASRAGLARAAPARWPDIAPGAPIVAAQAAASVPRVPAAPVVAAPLLADLPEPLAVPLVAPPAARPAAVPAPAARPVAVPAPAARPVAVPPSADAATQSPPAGPAQGATSTPGARTETPPAPPAERPVVTVTSESAQGRPLRVVERALSGSSANRADGWRDRVVVVPGGHRPGRPDQQQRDRARAQLPVAGPCRIVVLGCTVGAGQTVTTLMTGEVLASLRTDQVAVLDLNPGSGSLAERARTAPPVTQDSAPAGRMPGRARGGDQPLSTSRLEVIARSAADGQADPMQDDARKMFELVSARYTLTLADPAPSAVPRVLAVADQLVLVAPASAEAASAIAMTYEWLEAHGRAGLAAAAITVLNGVSRHTMRHVEQAEVVARGRCRAIVRVPWDDQLQSPAPEPARPPDPAPPPRRPADALLSPAAVHAYTALAGLLIAGLAEAPELRRARI
jgi:MinD-like ATPase involved in chromosome partitioning or flagellar assembly